MADPGSADFPVVLSAGSLRADTTGGWLVPHSWSDGGVVIEAPANGAGVLHVAVALCVLNDTFRESGALDLEVRGVRVSARGEFDPDTWHSTGVTYAVEVDSPSGADEVAALVARVDQVAEVPRALRAGMTVERR
ncbi:OsmC family protein [Nocardioides cynanchi]|uniref:OsmC family protein n=1 Tax=Nocardioides cynanchi TaxID=2558918 RepID=UPI001246173E|nr:OsmC family protein [Nocardioides cynanchi]